jgi:hypothetical protein
MSTGTLLRKMARIEQRIRPRQAPPHPILAQIRRDPAELLIQARLDPNPWQRKLLHSEAQRILLLCSRQAGKPTVAAALAVHVALLQARSLILVLSRSLRQSGELFRKVLDVFGALGRPMAVKSESALQMELVNGSRVVSLPGDEANVRCFSGVALLIIDEAAHVSDALYYSVRPMLARYGDAAARDPEAWRERLMHVDGVEPRDLVRWHGELLAIGWVELNVGQRGCGYLATAAGMRALKQVRQERAVVDEGAAQALVGSHSGSAPGSGGGGPAPSVQQLRKPRHVRKQVVLARSA